jgi:hypothetical protein
MKKSLPYIILGAGVGLLIGFYFFFKKQINRMIKEDEENSTGQNAGI